MRQTVSRRPPEKAAEKFAMNSRGAAGELHAAAGEHDVGEHLDLGMTVTVYCAGNAGANPQAADSTPDAAAHDKGTCFTEH